MKRDVIDRLYRWISDECYAVDREERFDELLNEMYDFSVIGGPFAHMQAASVLKEVDPTAYRCGVNDYMSDTTYEIDGEEYDRDKADSARSEFIDELEMEIDKLQERIEAIEESLQDLEDSTDNPADVIGSVCDLEAEKEKLESEVAELRLDVKACQDLF